MNRLIVEKRWSVKGKDYGWWLVDTDLSRQMELTPAEATRLSSVLGSRDSRDWDDDDESEVQS